MMTHKQKQTVVHLTVARNIFFQPVTG